MKSCEEPPFLGCHVYVCLPPRYKSFVSAADELRQIDPELRVSDAPADRVVYGRDLWPRDLIRVRAHDSIPSGPRAIVWPDSDEQVERIVAFARRTSTPIVPFGAGSGVCGAIAPSAETIVVDLKRLASYRVNQEQSLVEVGAGMLGITLENELQARGFTVGHFPSSILCSTVGGWLAARGAGQCSGRYGKIEDMVVGADVVLGTAERVPMHWRARGPNLTPLMVGSEGTLGIITRARLRLHRAPEARAFSAYSFANVEQGWEALREVYQAGLRPAVARLYDALDTALAASKSHGGAPRDPSLVLRAALKIPRAINRAVRALEGRLLQDCRMILIFEGERATTARDSADAQLICARYAGTSLGEAPARAWLKHRYSVSYRQSPLFRMGAFSDTMEVAAPWSRLKAVYDDVRRALGRYVVVLAHLSHAYPGGCSIYFTFSARASSDARALALYDELWPAALQAAIGAGATLSHHHGVGRNKAPFMRAELGHGLELMRAVKRAWDPDSLLNPGALLPDSANDALEPSRRTVAQEPCVLDRHSLLADLDASLTLDECENLLARQGYGLRIQRQGSGTLAEWLAAGMPGARSRWEDPVDQVLVGLTARLAQGQGFTLLPAPRRAVGPDLLALFVGERRAGTVVRVTLRVHPHSSQESRALPGSIESRDVLESGEAKAWESAIAAVRS